MSRLYVGIDNGVSGSVALLLPGGYSTVFATPTFTEFGYQKDAREFRRVNFTDLTTLLRIHRDAAIADYGATQPPSITLERPMVNPKRFDATVSALRAYEASLITLALAFDKDYAVQTIDSKKWQKMFLPDGCKGPALKKASTQRGCETWPQHREWIVAHGDADALFIAEYARRTRA